MYIQDAWNRQDYEKLLEELWRIFQQALADPEVVGMLTAIAIVVGVCLLISLVLSLVLYILKAKGLYTMAKRRGIEYAWLAWIPYADYWVAGSLSDQYKTTVQGKKSYNRIILLALMLASVVLSGSSMGISFGMLEDTVENALRGGMEAYVLLSMLGSFVDLLQFGVSMAGLVFWQITLYDIYSAAAPNSRVAYLVLGIIFPVTVPFFLFFNRKKDEGMRIPGQPQQPQPLPGETEYL